jgi:hypothetical protein
MNLELSKLIRKVKNEKATHFDLQELVKFYAENKLTITIGEVIMLKEYIRKGAANLGVSMKDVQDVYNSFSKEK